MRGTASPRKARKESSNHPIWIWASADKEKNIIIIKAH